MIWARETSETAHKSIHVQNGMRTESLDFQNLGETEPELSQTNEEDYGWTALRRDSRPAAHSFTIYDLPNPDPARW